MSVCNLCDRSFIDGKALFMHSNSKHSAEYECSHCDRMFTTEAGRDQHEESKHPEYECTYCDRTFRTEEGRDQHEEAKHPEYECTYCDRTFTTSEGRDQHEEAKHPDYECTYCDRTFRTEEGRDQHEEAKHPEYGCTYCDRTFTTSEGRDQHENAKHAASWSTFYPPSYQLRDPVTSWEFTPAPSGDHSDAPLAEDSDVSDDNSDVLSDDHRESQQTLLAVEREVDKELSSSGLTPSPPTSPPGYEDELVEVVIALQSCSVRPEYGSILCDMDTLEHHVTGAVEQQPHIAGSPSLGLEHTITSQTHDTYSAQQASCSMQAELYSHSSVPSGATLPDLTKLITKAGDYAVARGGFGDIWKCIYQTDQGPIDVAVKSLLVYTSDQLSENMEKKFERLRRELTTCARLDHKNILPVFGYTHGFGLLMAIVYPWAKNGNLTTYLEHEDAALTVFRRFKILADVTAGLQYIHANNIIHGDLTGPNVLIHADGTACLADFGLSLVYSEVITKSAAPWTSAFHGNLRWLAPELLGHSDDDLPVRPSKHSDVYSFGGIMLQVLTSKIPYHYLGEASVILRIGSGVKPSRSRYPVFSDEYWHFIEECWSAEPLDRPSSERLVEVIIDELNSLSSSSTSL